MFQLVIQNDEANLVSTILLSQMDDTTKGSAVTECFGVVWRHSVNESGFQLHQYMKMHVIRMTSHDGIHNTLYLL